MTNGRLVSGTNVESDSYGIALCAECSMTSQNIGGGRSTYVAIVIVGPDGEPVPPCGRCRCLMAEHSDEETVILTQRGPKKLLGDIYPYASGY